MSTSTRYYLVEDDDTFKEIPKKHVQELKERRRKLADLAGRKLRLAEVMLDMVFRTPVDVLADHYEYLYFDEDGFLDQGKLDLELVYFSKIMHGQVGDDFWDSWCSVTLEAEEAAERLGIDLRSPDEDMVVNREERYANLFRWEPDALLRRRIHVKSLGSNPKKRWEALGADIDLEPIWTAELENPFLEGGGPARTTDNAPLGGIYLFEGGHHRETRYYRGGYLIDEYNYPKVDHSFNSELHNYWNQILVSTMAWGVREDGEVVWNPNSQQPGQLSKLHASLQRVIDGRQPLICLTEENFAAEAALDSSVEESLAHILLRARNTRGIEVGTSEETGHIFVSQAGLVRSHIDLMAFRSAGLSLDRRLTDTFDYYVGSAQDVLRVCDIARSLTYRELLEYWLASIDGPYTTHDRLINCLLTGVPVEHAFSGLYEHRNLEERLFRERKMLVRLGARTSREAEH